MAPWDWAEPASSSRQRVAQGVVLGLGAPSGWLAWRTLRHGVDPIAEVMGHPELYVYMAFGTTLAFALFALRLSISESHLQQANARLSRLAVTDELTGLRNALFFRTRADEAWSDAVRSGAPFSLIALDLDHFKRVNDQFGHQAGDDVLRELGRRIRDGVRGADTAARVGGEEFSILLPTTDAESAVRIAERLREAVELEPFDTRAGPLDITCSAGVTTRTPENDVESFHDFYELADQALYEAKEQGRNRVVRLP